MKLSTKFLLASLLISVGLTSASLFLVRRVIGTKAREGVEADLKNSVRTFQNVQSQREASRIRAARLIADLPILRALMTTEDRRTIQDGSESLSRMAEADLFTLADRAGRIMALHTNVPGFDEDTARTQLQSSLQNEVATDWWFGNGHLYEISVQPIYFGHASEERVLGYMVLGYEIDDRIVKELSQVADSEVAFFFGDILVRSTLPAANRSELTTARLPNGESETALGGEHFLADVTQFDSASGKPVRLAVLKSLDRATSTVRNLNGMLTVTGIIAVTCGAILVFFISHTFTRPLERLVAGVRALGRGDYEYPLRLHGNDEVAEVTAAFQRMREDLHKTQRELVENEKLATIGRMASSISHDLRHHLVAIMANAEFLVDERRRADEREELYGEVRAGVAEMNDLIESLLEFSRTRASLRPSHCTMQEIVEHVVQTARMHPAYHDIAVSMEFGSDCEGCFDAKKLERVLHNLLLNAFAAVDPAKGSVSVTATRVEKNIEIRVADNGPGIPEDLWGRIFEPFFSFGKENGTGLGLSVAQKIVQDHGGELHLENSSSRGTVFLVSLPVSTSSPMAANARN